MRRPNVLRCAIVASMLYGVSLSAFAQNRFAYSDLGASWTGSSVANAINDLGQVVGYGTSGPQTSALIWNGTSATVLSALAGGTNTQATDINNSGAIAGSAVPGGGTFTHAVRWDAGVVTDLTGAGSLNGGSAYGINESGVVVGGSLVVSGTGIVSTQPATTWSPQGSATLHGTLPSYGSAINDSGAFAGYTVDPSHAGSLTAASWAPGYALLSAPVDSAARDINNAGVIVGSAGRFNGVQAGYGSNAWSWSGGMGVDLQAMSGVPNVLDSAANALNEHTQIVGRFQLVGGLPRAALWENGQMIDLNSFVSLADGWLLADATDINEAGSIVGTARNSVTGETHAFLLSAVPEPSGYALAGLGALMVAWAVRRRSDGPLPADSLVTPT